MDHKAIVLGNDHTNSIGLIHSLGRCGVYTIAVVWGRKTGIVPASRYVSEFYSSSTPNEGVRLIIDKFGGDNSDYVVFPSCDDAAAVLELFRPDIPSNIKFQHVRGEVTLEQLDNKDIQVELARRSGFNVPKSWSIRTMEDIPEDLIYPCISKALVAREGAKADLIVSNNKSELENALSYVFARNSEVLLQQYVKKDFDYDVMGCRFLDGEIFVPLCCKKLGLYPPNVGLATICETTEVPSEIVNALSNYLKDIDYYGIFDFEFMHSVIDDKNYFIECNLRNSGSNEFTLKAGYNIPLYHFEDFTGKNNRHINRSPVVSNYYIWEMHHTLAFLHRQIGLKQWIRDLKKSKGFLTYYRDDKKPFYIQYLNWVLHTLHLRKNESY